MKPLGFGPEATALALGLQTQDPGVFMPPSSNADPPDQQLLGLRPDSCWSGGSAFDDGTKRVRVRHVHTHVCTHMHVHYAQAHMHMRVSTCVCTWRTRTSCASAHRHWGVGPGLSMHTVSSAHRVHVHLHAWGVKYPAVALFAGKKGNRGYLTPMQLGLQAILKPEIKASRVLISLIQLLIPILAVVRYLTQSGYFYTGYWDY